MSKRTWGIRRTNAELIWYVISVLILPNSTEKKKRSHVLQQTLKFIFQNPNCMYLLLKYYLRRQSEKK